jgi:hypothetical protein
MPLNGNSEGAVLGPRRRMLRITVKKPLSGNFRGHRLFILRRFQQGTVHRKMLKESLRYR